MAYNIGPKIGIEGETEFRNSVRKINDEYKALEAETKAVAAAFEAQGDEQGKLEATSKQLQKQIDKQKEKTVLLEDAVAKASQKFGASSIEATRLRGALFDTKATVAQLESELKDTNDQLEQMGDPIKEYEDIVEDYRKAIDGIDEAYKTLKSETKAVIAMLDAHGDENRRLEATSEQLQKQIEMQREKVDYLVDSLKIAADLYGENSIEVTRMKGALFDTQATIAKLESELKDTTTRLGQADDAMEDFEESTDDAGKAAVDFGDILAGNLVSDLIMDGLREMAELVKDFAVGSIEAAADVQAATAQFDQTFSGLQTSAKASLEGIADDTNIASTRLQGSFTTIYAFAKNAGADVSTALTLSSRAMVAAADNAAYYNKSIADATEQLQSFLKGNYENDAALGISATETTRNAKANQLYAKSFQELSESQKVDVLLAMVEAGNEASGAIGQAARESDSWENVTGELAEVMRLLQAEAGKPALKKLVPIIQKITKEGYELIEDIDWEGFGDTVADIADGVIEYGPGIVRMIAAVAAGIVAFKATQKVGELASLASSFIGIGTAAQTAGTAVATSGAIASASPWGLVALAISGVVSLVVTAAMSAETAAGSLDKAMDRLDESMERANTTYETSKSEIEGAAYTAEYYVGRLEELEKAGLDTAAAHKEYELVVKELNELIPDLNLVIDEQTGLVEGGTEAIRDNIDAWKEQATSKALQEKMTDVLEARGEAEADVIAAEAEILRLQGEIEPVIARRADIEQEVARKQEEQRRIQKLLTEARSDDVETQDALIRQYEELDLEIGKLSDELEGLAETEANNQAEQNALTDSITDAKEKLEGYDAQIQYSEESLRLHTEQLAANTDQQQLLTEAQQAVKTNLENLALEYSEATAAARESIETQVGLFEELTMKSDWSAEKILQNWESQRLAFDNYSANLQKAVDMGLDEALVQQLSDGSVESMQILDAMVSDTDISIDEINAAFDKTEQSKATLSKTMGEIEVDLETRMDEIVKDAEAAGLEIPEGLASGVAGNSQRFINEVISMATAGIDWFEKIFDINSPSHVMEKEADYIVGGAAGRIKKITPQFAQSMANLAGGGFDAFQQERLERAESYPDLFAASAVTNNSSQRTTNYGGFNIQIYQQPGESADDLAYRVMDIIQTEVAAKGAVFHN